MKGAISKIFYDVALPPPPPLRNTHTPSGCHITSYKNLLSANCRFRPGGQLHQPAHTPTHKDTHTHTHTHTRKHTYAHPHAHIKTHSEACVYLSESSARYEFLTQTTEHRGIFNGATAVPSLQYIYIYTHRELCIDNRVSPAILFANQAAFPPPAWRKSMIYCRANIYIC